VSPRSTDERIADIAQWAAAAREAEVTLRRAETAFDRGVERVAFNAILYALLAIGEAVKALPDDVKAASPHINWVGITGMRDVLAHEYFRISASVVQDAVDQPLSELLAWCRLHGAEGPPASSS
jgi:uncharacterized protein with HEPN domain